MITDREDEDGAPCKPLFSSFVALLQDSKTRNLPQTQEECCSLVHACAHAHMPPKGCSFIPSLHVFLQIYGVIMIQIDGVFACLLPHVLSHFSSNVVQFAMETYSIIGKGMEAIAGWGINWDAFFFFYNFLKEQQMPRIGYLTSHS